MLLIEPENDDFIPERSRILLREGLASSRAELEIIRTPGGHLMPGSQERIDQIMRRVAAWVGRE